MQSYSLPQSGSIIFYRNITEGNIITLNFNRIRSESPHVIHIGMVGMSYNRILHIFTYQLYMLHPRRYYKFFFVYTFLYIDLYIKIHKGTNSFQGFSYCRIITRSILGNNQFPGFRKPAFLLWQSFPLQTCQNKRTHSLWVIIPNLFMDIIIIIAHSVIFSAQSGNCTSFCNGNQPIIIHLNKFIQNTFVPLSCNSEIRRRNISFANSLEQRINKHSRA